MLALGLIACGDDTSVTDTGATDAEGRDGLSEDGGAVFDCSGMADGTACGEELLCIGEVCLNTQCGDGYIDEAAGEDCDDENEISGDGCEPASCVFSCTTEEESCSDGDPCNGTESCSVTSHRCEAGMPPVKETACDLEDMSVGVCSGGLCAMPGCGNGTREGAEICDDGNEDQDDGCKSDCTFTCEEDIVCSDGNACTGEETCELATHTCTTPPALSCDDVDTCTADSCDAELGCVFTLIDGDEDGFAEDACTTPGLQGGDCNDSNDGVYPGAPELCDDINNDCDEMTDEDIVEVECRADRDNDTYGDDGASSSDCTCPPGTIPPRPDGNEDCDDRDSNVHEGQLSYFATTHCSDRLCGDNDPYDYNCDGRETQRYTGTYSNALGCRYVSSGMFALCLGSGWSSGGVPPCGIAGLYRSCGVGPTGCSLQSTSLRVQSCR